MTTEVFAGRAAFATVDLGALGRNVARLCAAARPAATWVVVKADAYGHGAPQVAATALAAGASGLCVALVQEGVELRRCGVTAPILILSEQPVSQSHAIVAHDLIPTVCSSATVNALAHAAQAAGRTIDVHVKVDTGMHRMGVVPDEAASLLALVEASDTLRLAGLFTHLAVADDPSHPMNATQLERFARVVDEARAAGHRPDVVHAANSAATLALPEARLDLVRVGIAMYGIVPGPGVAGLCHDLEPVMRLEARVSRVARVRAGEGVSYGLRHICSSDSTIATVPLGYADGVPRRLSETGEVLIGGRRRPIVGVVTMDQLMVDCGDDPVAVGDEVVLLGRQGDHEIRAEEWAEQVGTIGYEIVCGLSARLGRHHTPWPGDPR